MQKNLQFPVLILIGASLISASILALRRYPVELYRSSAEENASIARLIIDNGDAERMFQGPVSLQMSFLEAIYAAANGSGLDFQYVNQNNTTRVVSLDGKIQTGANHSSFYLNDAPIPVDDLGRRQIKELDTLKAVYR